ncbi:MAG: hypothetical protein DRJ41_01880 [Thermoprotei archaeon]|nr:MAG: hypothetical protein DRJ41_01880 [Thermoprotei archaeon]
MGRKLSIAIKCIMVVFLSIILIVLWMYTLAPAPDITLKIDRSVEVSLAKKGVKICDVLSLVNKLSKTIWWGGAGGMGLPVVNVSKATFIKIVNSSYQVFRAFRQEKTKIVKTFYAVSDVPVIIKYEYSIQEPFGYHTVELTEDHVTFKKNYNWCIATSAAFSLLILMFLGGFLSDLVTGVR